MEIKELICIRCPLGCLLEVHHQDNEIQVKGNKCNRGKEYAIKECNNPTRIVTSTIKVVGGGVPITSVKTNGEVPKDKIMDVMKIINKSKAISPLAIGDVVIKNVANTKIDVIVTKEVTKNE